MKKKEDEQLLDYGTQKGMDYEEKEEELDSQESLGTKLGINNNVEADEGAVSEDPIKNGEARDLRRCGRLKGQEDKDITVLAMQRAAAKNTIPW